LFDVATKNIKIDSHPTCILEQMSNNYLDLLTDDLINLIINKATDDTEYQLNQLTKQILKPSCYKRIKAKQRRTCIVPAHYILDNLFHINPNINLEQIIKGPFSVSYPDLFNPFYKDPAYEDNYITLVIDKDISVAYLLIKIVKLIGSYNINRYHINLDCNCINDIFIFTDTNQVIIDFDEDMDGHGFGNADSKKGLISYK